MGRKKTAKETEREPGNGLRLRGVQTFKVYPGYRSPRTPEVPCSAWYWTLTETTVSIYRASTEYKVSASVS